VKNLLGVPPVKKESSLILYYLDFSRRKKGGRVKAPFSGSAPILLLRFSPYPYFKGKATGNALDRVESETRILGRKVAGSFVRNKFWTQPWSLAEDGCVSLLLRKKFLMQKRNHKNWKRRIQGWRMML
jgi:hypothetical protein